MNTEITDKDVKEGWIFYDGDCPFCLTWVRRLQRIPALRRFGLLPLQTPEARDRLQLKDASLLEEMRLLLPDGRVLGGADAVIELARRIWWAWPLWVGSHLPGGLPLLRAGYRFVAARRSCLRGACTRRRRGAWLDWLPLLCLPVTTLFTRGSLPDWMFMWFLAFAIFCGCKWLTWRLASAAGAKTTPARSVAYLFAWPGMDAEEFLTEGAPAAPRIWDWVWATVKTLLGVALIGFVATEAQTLPPLVAGWLGMVGIVLLFHFGLFHGLALLWQCLGVAAKPVMRSPLLASSLASFWGKRWNTAFNTLACDLAYRPLARRVGSASATLVVFLISGLIHDLVISLPAHGGYGWPTAYFLLQGGAVLLERSRAGRALGLGRGLRGWLFVMCCTAVPAVGLFHPPFIRNVILPMFQAIGATSNSL